MDWVTYNKAKELEKNMNLLTNLAEDRLDIKYENPIYPLYSFLSQREDFKEYIRKVFAELDKEFHKLGDPFGNILGEEEVEKFAQEYYNENILGPAQAVFDENGDLVKTADVDDNGDPYIYESDVVNAFIAGYNKATEL